MSHPIVALQTALVLALREDAGLAALVGDAIYDAPPPGVAAPYVVIARHDVVPRDGDLAPGHEHRVVLNVWSDQPSRRAALEIAERVQAVVEGFVPTGMAITHRGHERTDTAIDLDTGRARVALAFRFHTETAA
jgi:hypothetical protein